MPKELLATGPGQLDLRGYKEEPPEAKQVCIKSQFSSEKHGTALTIFRELAPKKRWDNELELFLSPKEKASPFPRRLGNMTVGRIVEVGKDVTHFKVGDRVYGPLPIRETHTVEEARVYLVPSGLGDEEIVCFDPAGVACSVQKKGKEILLSKI